MSDFSLARDFPEHSRDDWLELVEQTLKGADFDKRLVSSTYDGIAVQPLYTADDAEQSIVPRGLAPQPWHIAQAHGAPDPAAANAAILADLEAGATAVVLNIAASPEAPGIRIWRLSDMARTLRDVRLDAVPVHLNAGARGLEAAALLCAHIQQQGLAAAEITGSLGIDPIGALATTGALPASIADHCAAAIEAGKIETSIYAMTVSTQPFHQAGCSDAQELGLALAAGVEYLRGLEAAGMALDKAALTLRFVLTADADVFTTIAKFRAWPALWTQVCNACGLVDAAGACDAETATRMLTRHDPWVNMLRATAATFAAATGGARAITVAPFSAAIGLPDGFARRIARNTQIILQEESHIARVADAAHGAWYLERLTRQLAQAAWSCFQTIEAEGGMAQALADGTVQSLIAGVSDARARDIARRKVAITGVSEFPNIAEKPVATEEAQGAAAPDTVDAADWSELMKTAAADEAPRFARAGAEHCAPLAAARLSQPFETLRGQSDCHLKSKGVRPKVFLAKLGSAADFTARAMFAQNFFEAGGIEAVSGDDANGGLETAFTDSGAALACICSSDDVYAQQATATAKALRAGGAAQVFLAGRPGELQADLAAAGVDGFIYAGCDVLDMLNRIHSETGLVGKG